MRRRPRRPDGKRGRIKRRILKKTAPLKWGTIALISDDDRPHQDATIPPQKRRDVAVVVWRDLKQYRRSYGGKARRSYACYRESGDKIHHGSIGGTLHFPTGSPLSVVVHEAAHAALHGERILNGGRFDFDLEERFCYRLQRLCESIWEYLAEE